MAADLLLDCGPWSVSLRCMSQQGRRRARRAAAIIIEV